MNITNITILRVIAHEVVKASQIVDRPAVLSEELVTLDAKGQQLVARRLVETISSGSHCVDVTVDDGTAGSPFDRATSMLDADDESFLATSKHLAGSLSAAQTSGAIKAGSAIFIQGECTSEGMPARFIAIIKADSDQALSKGVAEDRITLTYVNDMLLGESQRLFKVAFFIETAEPDGSAVGSRQTGDFRIKVYDHLMQTSGNGNAAAYFYSAFLKCKLAFTSARKTKEFYDVTRAYIESLNIPPGEKIEYQSDLISYMRGNTATLEPREFARSVFPSTHWDDFVRTLRDAGITDAITKETDLIKAKLRRRSVRFSSKVTITAASGDFDNSIRIMGTTVDGWTELMIRGSVETQS